MTKDELEREAEVYAKENYCDEVRATARNACLDCARLREKRIADLEKENEQLKKQVNTYLEMLADETKKHIPDSKGYTIRDKSLTETTRELQEEKDKLRECLSHIVYMAESGLHTKNELAFARFIAEAKDLLKE